MGRHNHQNGRLAFARTVSSWACRFGRRTRKAHNWVFPLEVLKKFSPQLRIDITCKVCNAVKEESEMFKQNLQNHPSQKQATKLSFQYRALSSLATDLLEQRNAFETFRARFLMHHALSITRNLIAIGRDANLALASVSSEQAEVFWAHWDSRYQTPGQVLTASIAVDSENAEAVQVHITDLAGSLLSSCRLGVEATISELENKMRESLAMIFRNRKVAEITFVSDDGQHAQKHGMLKDYARLHARSSDYDIDLIVKATKPALYSLSVDRTSRGALVTDVRTAQLYASYDTLSQHLPLLIVELKPIQYVPQTEKRQAVWLRMGRNPERPSLRFGRRRAWYYSTYVRNLRNWRKFAVKAERGWHKCVHSV